MGSIASFLFRYLASLDYPQNTKRVVSLALQMAERNSKVSSQSGRINDLVGWLVQRVRSMDFFSFVWSYPRVVAQHLALIPIVSRPASSCFWTNERACRFHRIPREAAIRHTSRFLGSGRYVIQTIGFSPILGVKVDGPIWIVNRFLASSLEVLASCPELDVVADNLSSLLETFTTIVMVFCFATKYSLKSELLQAHGQRMVLYLFDYGCLLIHYCDVYEWRKCQRAIRFRKSSTPIGFSPLRFMESCFPRYNNCLGPLLPSTTMTLQLPLS